MDHELLHKLEESMPARVHTVTKAKRGCTKYEETLKLHVNLSKRILFTQVVDNSRIIMKIVAFISGLGPVQTVSYALIRVPKICLFQLDFCNKIKS